MTHRAKTKRKDVESACRVDVHDQRGRATLDTIRTASFSKDLKTLDDTYNEPYQVHNISLSLAAAAIA